MDTPTASRGQRVYLDHASASPLRPEVIDAMTTAMQEFVGDPGRLHHEALRTRAAIEEARDEVAAFFGARNREVMFCSSAAEAINTAHWWATGHAVTSAVEHLAVRDSLQRSAAAITVIAVDHDARYDPDEVVAATRADTTLVSVQLANHEVGTIQAAARVCAALREHPTRVHVDAAAAAGHIPVSFRDLDADLMTVAASTFGGPSGAAALLIRRGVRLPVLVVGGAQERARRAGLEDTPAIVGFAAACRATAVEAEATQQRQLTDAVWTDIATIPGVVRYGARGDGSLPHLLCISVDGVEAEPILLALDQRGVAVHSGSACSSELWEPSPILAAMGVDAQHSLRISAGWNSTSIDGQRCASALHEAVTQLRALRPPVRHSD